MSDKNQYAERDIMALDKKGGHYIRHLSAMTGECLHDKSDIAAELAWRDSIIIELCDSLTWAMRFVDQVRIENPMPVGSGEDIAYRNAIESLAKARGES